MARRYADAHRLTFNLDLDRIRDLLGDWEGDPHNAGLLTRAAALAAARVHLLAGHDVVVPQFLGRPQFLEQAEALAAETGAAFHEIVLFTTRDDAVYRFAARPASPPLPPDEVAAMYDRLAELLPSRPRALVLTTVHGREDEAYAALVASLGT